MKKVVIILLFLALSIVGMAQRGSYKVERFCNDELKADTSKTAQGIRTLIMFQKDLKVYHLTIEPNRMVFELKGKDDFKSTAQMSPLAFVKEKGDGKWCYTNHTIVEKLGDKDYVLKLENGTPIMYLTKLD